MRRDVHREVGGAGKPFYKTFGKSGCNVLNHEHGTRQSLWSIDLRVTRMLVPSPAIPSLVILQKSIFVHFHLIPESIGGQFFGKAPERHGVNTVLCFHYRSVRVNDNATM